MPRSRHGGRRPGACWQTVGEWGGCCCGGGRLGGGFGGPGQISFSQSAPSGHAAAATFIFDDVASTVTVRIENRIDASHDSLASRALTGLFWDMSPGLLPFTGVDPAHGGTVNNPAGHTPAQLWAFRGDLDRGSTPFGTQFGLGAEVFGVFGTADMLAPGGPRPEPHRLDGGILSATGHAYTGQYENPMFRSFVEFVFRVDGLFFAGGLEDIRVANVTWQFGSAFDERTVYVAPLPSAAWVGFLGLAGLAGFGILRSQSLRRLD